MSGGYMTIGIATRKFVAADSRLSFGTTDAPLTVGKIFTRRGGGLFVTAGDSRRTRHFEVAMKSGKEPKELEILEDESFEAAVLMPDSELIVYDTNFAPFPVGEDCIVIGSGCTVARSWMLNGADEITAIRRCIEVDTGCGYPIVVAYLNGRVDLIDENGNVTPAKKARR